MQAIPANLEPFYPGDPAISDWLREYIQKWQWHVPSSQYYQYGPIDKFLNTIFNEDNHLVEPQSCFRKKIKEADNVVLQMYTAGISDSESDNPDEDEDEDGGNPSVSLLSARDQRRGEILADYVDTTNEGKLYPDFGVSRMVSPWQNQTHNRVVVLMEIGLVPKPIRTRLRRHMKDGGSFTSATTRQLLRSTEVVTEKDKVIKQLKRYLLRLGRRGDGWDVDALGIAMVGAEVAFLKPVANGRRDVIWQAETGTPLQNINGVGWFSLYGPEWSGHMTRMRNV
ncbi:hypothetical protein TRAPUB_4452 [Trametes pubescens]|uniref:Uncharacterized protein n=1 Tax=Trametes pubescens TaxID=154538 RepID=A0A1M2VB82_TRAPU|nr:hypothetical protein TRAPUB_4452 [Trametes pubescens]